MITFPHRVPNTAAALLVLALSPAPPAHHAAPTPPAIFAIALTNVTDTSARLIFTTTQPMSSTIDLAGSPAQHIAQPDFEEIHAVQLDHLTQSGVRHFALPADEIVIRHVRLYHHPGPGSVG